MKIQLPQSFQYRDNGEVRAYVEEGKLYMPLVDFDKIMYQLTYQLKGNHRCCYCDRPLKPHQCTLDHIYPRTYGGISIPTNLKPCCHKCNEQKSDLLPKQYKQIRKISEGARKRKIIERLRAKNDELRSKHGIILPKEWYEMRENYSVIGMVTSERPTKRSQKYQRLQDQYERFGQFCKPVVVSANKFVLDGFMVLFLAKNLGINEPIPFITLENVIVNL